MFPRVQLMRCSRLPLYLCLSVRIEQSLATKKEELETMPRNSTRRSKKAQPAESVAAIGETVQVFDPKFSHLVAVEGSAIVHMPPASLHITRLVMCRNYVPHKPDSCSVGAQCKFVHVDVPVDHMRQQAVHVNYAWRSVDLVTYDRLPAGEMLNVLGPNNSLPTDDIPSEKVLATLGATHRKPDTQLSHCAHYYFNRMCSRGDRCNFIHAVHIDPTVKGDYKRAPPGQRPMEAAGSTFTVTDKNSSCRAPTITDEDIGDGGGLHDPADSLTAESAHKSPIVLNLAKLGGDLGMVTPHDSTCGEHGTSFTSAHHELPQAALSYSSGYHSVHACLVNPANGCGACQQSFSSLPTPRAWPQSCQNCSAVQTPSACQQSQESSSGMPTTVNKKNKKLKKSATVVPLEDIDPAAAWVPMAPVIAGVSSAVTSLDVIPHGAHTPHDSLHSHTSNMMSSQHFTDHPLPSPQQSYPSQQV